MNKSAAFITDLGRVLLDYDWDIFLQGICQHVGRPMCDLTSTLSRARQGKLGRKFSKGRVSSDNFYQEYCSLCDIDTSMLSFHEFLKYFNAIFTGKIEKTCSLLPILKRQFGSMVMITNTNEPHFNFVTEKFPEIFLPFDLVIASHKEGLSKPGRRIYELAIDFVQKQGQNPKHSLFVDDLAHNLDGALAAGIGKVFLFTPEHADEFEQYLHTEWGVNRV